MTDSFVAVNMVQLASANFSHALTAEAKKISRIFDCASSHVNGGSTSTKAM
jgi:hypothetical protein